MADYSRPTGADKANKTNTDIWAEFHVKTAVRDKLRAMADEVHEEIELLVSRNPEFHEEFLARYEFCEEWAERANEVKRLLEPKR